MFRKVKKLLKNNNDKKKDKKSRSQQAPSDDELFIDPKRFVLTERYKILWDYLMKHAPNADGIFRVPGSQPRIRALKLLIDSQNTPDLEQYDVHVVGGVFKQYLREQKEPLLTHDLYEGFIAAHGIEDEKKKIETAKSLLNNLPLGFLTALRALVELLYKIDRNSDVNLMSMTNLAIVFSPTLLRARDETVAKIMQDSTAAHGIVLFLLSQPELLTFFGVKATDKNEHKMTGEPKSDPTLISEPRTIATAGNRDSRLLAQSSPNLVPPASSSPVLLQVGEHALTPRGRLVNRERTSSSSSNSPTRSPRHSKIKLSSDYLSKDTMNIIAALDMIIEGKDISSSDDDTLVKSSDSGPSSPPPSMNHAASNNNNTNNKPANITSEEFNIGAAISQPLKPKSGEKIEHLDSESEDSEIDSEEELVKKPKKQTPPPQPVPVPVAVNTEPAPRKGNAKIGSNRVPLAQPKKELFEQPLKSSQSMPRISPRKDSNGNLPRSPRKDSATNGTGEPKKNSPRNDSTANGVVDTKKNSPRNETTEPKKESPRTEQPKHESPRKEEPVQPVEVKEDPVAVVQQPEVKQEKPVSQPLEVKEDPVAVVQPTAEVKQEEPVVVPEPVKVKDPTPPTTPRVQTPRKLPTPPQLSPRDTKPPTPRQQVPEVTPPSPRDTKPPTPRQQVPEVAPLSPRETKPPTPRKEEVIEAPKSPSPPKVASPVHSPRKIEEDVQQQPEEVKQPVEPQIVVTPKVPIPVAPKKTAVSPKTVTPKTIVPKVAPPKQQLPKQTVVSPRAAPGLQRTQTAPEIPSPRAKVIQPDPVAVNEVPNPDYKISDGVTPIALPKTPVAHVKLTPLIVSPKTPGQGKTALNSPKGPQSPHTPTSGRTLASPKKATAVIVSPRGASGELTRTSSVSVITKPTTILTPDVDKNGSPRSMTTEDVAQKEKQKNNKLKRQHLTDELLNDLDLIEQFTCRMYQDMEVYNKEQTGFVVEIFKDITKFLTSSLKQEKVMITPADINKFTSGSNARFITDMDAGKGAIRDQFKVIMGLSGEIKEKIFAPASTTTDSYLENLSFMFDQITEFLENVIAEMSEDDDEEEAAPGIDPQLLQLKNALEEAIQKLERDIVTKFSERINKAASFYSVPHLNILFDSLVWMKKKMNGFNPPVPDDQIIQQVLRISQPNVTGNMAPDAMTKAHSLIASCNAELKDLTEFQLQKMKTEATNALNNFDGSIARYRIINSVKILNQIAQFVAKFKQVPLQMSDNVVPTATKDESEQLAKETTQSIDRLKLIGTVIKKQLLNINGLEQAILVSKIIKTIKMFVMSAAEVEVNGQDLIDFATSYDKLSDELKSIVARGLPVTEASPEDVPKVKSLLVAGGVIMDEFIASLPKLKENVTALKAKAFPHTHIEFASQRVKLIYKLLELIVQVNKSYDGPLSAAPRALSMPTVLSPPGSPSLLPTSPRAQPQQQPVSPRTATGAGTAASNPGLIRSHSSPAHDSGIIEEKMMTCRQLISVVLSKVNSINDINYIVAMGQVGKALKKILGDAAKKQPVAFVNLTLNLEPSTEALSPEHLEKMVSLKNLIINLFKDVDKELSHIASFGINNTMALSVLNYIQQLLSKLN